MKRPRHLRPQRRRIFVGCEGLSEVEYISLIRQFADVRQLPIHIEIANLAPAGDPLARVEQAIKRIAKLERNREKFSGRYLILDDDQTAQLPGRAETAIRLADQQSLVLIWQTPCHEALLLRHFDGHTNDKPPTTILAGHQLRAVWADYGKGMERQNLGKRLDMASVIRVASVESGLSQFLYDIGLLE
jgi:RloB-like protein